ncbi:MAG: sporulation transcriptional regulator SpoIIID [Christensenellaceae bacterium]|jgi:putative DeoR family transcriptional regulator (stage III sporulation protein D)|nr:sporulation transcriptional regulator SpoIIID [Christensenellaceae bacterium]
MYSYIEERVLREADYIIDHEVTVRAAAREFKISKSTVHKDMVERLKTLDPQRAKAVGNILRHNKEVRHIRGGMATYRKYKGGAAQP